MKITWTYVGYIIGLIVLAVVGFILFLASSEGSILRELGLVLFVTVVVTGIVGELSVRHFTGGIVQRLTIKLRRVFNDRSLLDMLDRTIFDPDFVRPWYRLALTIEPLEGHQDLLRVSLKNEYEVKNVSGAPKKYKVAGWLDDILRPNDEAGFTSFKMGSPGEDLMELAVKRYEVKKDGRISVEESTRLLENEESYHVSIEGMQFNRKEDLFIFHMLAVTGELDLAVELSGGLTFDELGVFPYALHHILNAEFQTNYVKKPSKTAMECKIPHVLLPYQGVEVRWRPPRPEEQPASTSS